MRATCTLYRCMQHVMVRAETDGLVPATSVINICLRPCWLHPDENSLMSRHLLCRWWTLAEANSDSWHTSSRALPSDSSFRRDLACLLEEPPNWQRAQVPLNYPFTCADPQCACDVSAS